MVLTIFFSSRVCKFPKTGIKVALNQQASSMIHQLWLIMVNIDSCVFLIKEWAKISCIICDFEKHISLEIIVLASFSSQLKMETRCYFSFTHISNSIRYSSLLFWPFTEYRRLHADALPFPNKDLHAVLLLVAFKFFFEDISSFCGSH